MNLTQPFKFTHFTHPEHRINVTRCIWLLQQGDKRRHIDQRAGSASVGQKNGQKSAWQKIRGSEKSQVRQCFDFCTADFKSSVTCKSAVQEPKHCLIWLFSLRLLKKFHKHVSQHMFCSCERHPDCALYHWRCYAFIPDATWEKISQLFHH